MTALQELIAKKNELDSLISTMKEYLKEAENCEATFALLKQGSDMVLEVPQSHVVALIECGLEDVYEALDPINAQLLSIDLLLSA